MKMLISRIQTLHSLVAQMESGEQAQKQCVGCQQCIPECMRYVVRVPTGFAPHSFGGLDESWSATRHILCIV